MTPDGAANVNCYTPYCQIDKVIDFNFSLKYALETKFVDDNDKEWYYVLLHNSRIMTVIN